MGNQGSHSGADADIVEIYSNSIGAWFPGHIVNTNNPEKLTYEFMFAGEPNRKHIKKDIAHTADWLRLNDLRLGVVDIWPASMSPVKDETGRPLVFLTERKAPDMKSNRLDPCYPNGKQISQDIFMAQLGSYLGIIVHGGRTVPMLEQEGVLAEMQKQEVPTAIATAWPDSYWDTKNRKQLGGPSGWACVVHSEYDDASSKFAFLSNPKDYVWKHDVHGAVGEP